MYIAGRQSLIEPIWTPASEAGGVLLLLGKLQVVLVATRVAINNVHSFTRVVAGSTLTMSSIFVVWICLCSIVAPFDR